MTKKSILLMKKLGICSSALGICLLSLPINPAYAGRYNASNATGGNTSNATGGNTSNATGGNTSNATGGKNSSRYGLSRYGFKVLIRASKLSAQLKTARASGNKAEVKSVVVRAKRFLRSIQRSRSSQSW